MWSGKNTPKNSPGAPSGSSPQRYGSPLRQPPDVGDVVRWHEQQLAMYRGMVGPALPSQPPPGLPLQNVAMSSLSAGAVVGLPDDDTSDFSRSQARSAHSIGYQYNSLGPGNASPGPQGVAPSGPGVASKVEAVGQPLRQMVASSDAKADPTASTAGQESQGEKHPEEQMVASSAPQGVSHGSEMVASSPTTLEKPDLLTEATDGAPAGAQPKSLSKAVGTHSSSSRAQQEGLRAALQSQLAEQPPPGALSPASRGSAATSEGRKASRDRVQPPDFTGASASLTAVLKKIEKLEVSLGSLRQSHQALELSATAGISDLKEDLEGYKAMQTENYVRMMELIGAKHVVPEAAAQAQESDIQRPKVSPAETRDAKHDEGQFQARQMVASSVAPGVAPQDPPQDQSEFGPPFKGVAPSVPPGAASVLAQNSMEIRLDELRRTMESMRASMPWMAQGPPPRVELAPSGVKVLAPLDKKIIPKPKPYSGLSKTTQLGIRG